MEEISPTRTNLLQRKAQILLAMQGADLLKNKRDVLIAEFLKFTDEMMDRRQALEDMTHQAYHALAIARAFDGEEVLKSASMAATRTVNIDIRSKKIWGVPIPDIERINLGRTVTERGYSFSGVPARVDIAARRFEDILSSVVAVAATDVLLRRLGDEIKRTTRRVNALEQILIPRLKGEARYISVTLDEREREDICRLKKIKGASRPGRGGRSNQSGKRTSGGKQGCSSEWRMSVQSNAAGVDKSESKARSSLTTVGK